jgi:hypothetical protein
MIRVRVRLDGAIAPPGTPMAIFVIRPDSTTFFDGRG